MDLKSIVQTGVKIDPPRILLHGIHKVGKSTFGAHAPSPIFLQTEDGLTGIDVPRFPIANSLDDVWQYMGLLINEDHQYSTFVIDTIDWLEKLIWDQVCKEKGVKNIKDIGWNKGYDFAMNHWYRLKKGLDILHKQKGMAILILAHNEVKPINPPDSESYDRYQIKLEKKAMALLSEWVDCILFAREITYVNNKKAVSSGERVIQTNSNPAWAAGTRYNIPDQIQLEFGELLKHIKNEKKRAEISAGEYEGTEDETKTTKTGE